MRLRPGAPLTNEEREKLLRACETLEGECARVEDRKRRESQDAINAKVYLQVNRTMTGRRGLVQPAIYEGQKALRGETVVWGVKDETPSVVIAKVSDIRDWVGACRSGMVLESAEFEGEGSEPDGA